MGAVGSLALDFLTSVLHLPLLYYQPLERRWLWDRFAQSPAMDLYGHFLWCLAGGAGGWALGWVLLRRLDEGGTARWARRSAGWILSLVLLAAALHIATLVTRSPLPLVPPR
jgi:hypothetical protein